MNPFAYERVSDGTDYMDRARAGGAAYIAGGTDLIQLLRDGIAEPDEIFDINDLPLRGISETENGVRIGALTRLSEIADDPTIGERYPALAEALRETASPQIRNMATIGGNLLQRTRCLYFRDPATPCNKRVPGSGCPAQDGCNRINAILGGSEHCIAVHPSDAAVALVALDATATVASPTGDRTIRIEDLYRLPGETPHEETVLEPGDLITEVMLPTAGESRRSHYLKIRDRASFEWALASCAVAFDLDLDTISDPRVAVGGVATKPWRLPRVEETLNGRRLDDQTVAEAAERATEGARPNGGNAYKVPLLKRTVARALHQMGDRL